MAPSPLAATLYAKDLARLARFYEQVFGLTRTQQEADFALLSGVGFELVIVQTPPEIAGSIAIASPPMAREASPIKLSLLVPRIEGLHALFECHGGWLRPAEAGWSWRGFSHLDGVDAEGNVLQLRVRQDEVGGVH